MMLGRGVARSVRKRGYSYLFGDIKDLLEQTDMAAVNLEGQ